MVSRRKIGVGTLILVLMTSGFWVLAVPFYEERCPICGGTNAWRLPFIGLFQGSSGGNGNSKQMTKSVPAVLSSNVLKSIMTQQSNVGMPSWLYWLYGAVFAGCVGFIWLFC